MKYLEKPRRLAKKLLKPIYITAFLVFFIPRLFSLGSDMSNYDASYWYPRMDEFTSSLLQGDFKGTYQQYHPGVVLLLTSGTSKYIFQELYEWKFHFNPRYIPQQFIKLQVASILPLVILISIMGTMIFFYLRKLINARFAFIFIIILSLEPFFLGISKYLHLSALTSMFMFTSFLTLYYYYNKESHKKFFYLSAVLMGLGVLTKIDASITIPVNIALIFLSEFKKEKLKNVILHIFIYSFIIVALFFILFPAMWVAPGWVLQKIMSDGIENTAFDSSGGESYTKIKALYYFETFFYRSLPTTFISFLLGIVILIINRRNYGKSEYKFFMWMIGYTLFNILVLSIPDKTKDRYLINLYPGMLFFSAIAFNEIIRLKNVVTKYAIITVTIVLYSFALYRYYPVYSFYYTELIGGASGITKLGMDIKNRGEYYAQAAEYMNIDRSETLAIHTNAVVAHREHIRTLGPFYYGKLYSTVGVVPDGSNIDYIVSRPDMNYLIPEEYCKLAATFGPKDPWGYKEVFVYKCEGLTNEYKNFRN